MLALSILIQSRDPRDAAEDVCSLLDDLAVELETLHEAGAPFPPALEHTSEHGIVRLVTLGQPQGQPRERPTAA